MTWQLMWHNVRVAALNAMLQLLVIHRFLSQWQFVIKFAYFYDPYQKIIVTCFLIYSFCDSTSNNKISKNGTCDFIIQTK